MPTKTDSYQLHNDKIKMFEKTGYWHLVFMNCGKTFMEFIHKDYDVIRHDFLFAKSKLDADNTTTIPFPAQGLPTANTESV